MSNVRLSVTSLVLVASLALIACSSTAQLDADAGHITFGNSLNTTTFVLSGEGREFEVGHDVAYRAAMNKAMGKGTIRLTATLNGTTILNQTAQVDEESWSLYGGTIPGSLLFEAGAFEMHVLDIGNNVLSAGSFSVR